MGKKEKQIVSNLKSHIGYHLRIVSNAVSYSFAKKLNDFDVTVAEWVILREMYSEDQKISPSVVAEMTGLTRGAVSKLIDRLLYKNLVTREESSDDRRFQDLKLTASAIRLVPKLGLIADENDDSFFFILTESEKKNLVKMLMKIAESQKLSTNPIE